MALRIIITYSLKEHGLVRMENGQGHLSGWLYALSKELLKQEPCEHIAFLGQDDKKRLEFSCSLSLFAMLKNDPHFIIKAVNLRRVRTERMSQSTSVLEYLCWPISEFDNDMDDPSVIDHYKRLSESVENKIHEGY